jgi:hypothetical protein
MSNENEYKATGEKKTSEDATTNEPEVTQEHELTPRERAALERLRSADPPLLLKVAVEEEPKIVPDHPNKEVGWALIMEQLGTTNRAFANGVLTQLGIASVSGGELSVRKLNFLFSLVISEKPKIERQAVLAVKMALVYLQTMSAGQRLANADVTRVSPDPEQRHVFHSEKMLTLSTAERAFSRLACTYVTLSDALTRSQTGGQEKVTVQNMLVSEGGQAFVGNVTRPERGRSPEMSQASPRALTRSQAVPMPVVEESARTVVPVGRKAAKRNGKARP